MVFSDNLHLLFGQIENVTVAVGRDAILTCQVDSLGSYRVGILPPFFQSCYTDTRLLALLTVDCLGNLLAK